ncbi:SPOR domain-containing protein [Actinotalea solisilvae]|uniref:SPOR domain-containing protein n=1 Tax=Actinotalea solisilvae TaxID=2072922 RepID=UPI0018F10B52|nr:SPOR domain-containing protein [Actinotalea solisilvae]
MGTADDAAPGGDFWFNPGTGEVEQGRVSPWTDRMGPYPTREAAEQALSTARERSESWDDEDRRWREGG